MGDPLKKKGYDGKFLTVSAKRNRFGKYLGSLSETEPLDAAVHVVKATQERLQGLYDKYCLPFYKPSKEFERLVACGVDRGLV